MLYSSFGKGGGLSIVVKEDAFRNSFSITNCRFFTNLAERGSGLFFSLLDQTRENSISIQNTEFVGNGDSQSLSGGGVHIESFAYGTSEYGNYIENWEGNQFRDNSAQVGGGLFVSSFVHSFSGCTECIIYNNTFTGNTAVYWSAIALYSYSTQGQSDSNEFILSNCIFESNSVLHLGNVSQTGLGTVYNYQCNIKFWRNVTFNSNSGSALVMINARANFSSSYGIFTNNSASTKGGAIQLLGSSYMLIDEGTNMLFDSNSAYYQGGAIYKQYLEKSSEGFLINCFVRSGNILQNPDEWKASIIFRGNTVSGSWPNAIHTTSISPCYVNGVSGGKPLCWSGWTYDNDPCNNDTVKRHISTGFKSGHTNSAIITATPSWPFSAESDVTMQNYFGDDMNMDASGYVTIANNTDQVTTSSLDMMMVRGESNEGVRLLLEAVGDSPAQIELTVRLQDCPSGFVMIDKGCSCPKRSVTSVTCNQSHKTAVIMDNYWMGKIGDDYYLTYCPTHLCQKKKGSFQFLPNSSDALSDHICADGRRGIVCGECKEGFCLSINSYSYRCIDAKGTNLYSSIATYISTVYLPYGCILVALAIFNFKVTDGSLNGLVLFVQMITTTFDLTEHDTMPLTKSSSFFPKTYRFIYGVFNLDFIEKHIKTFCFSSQLNILSVLLLDYLLFIVPVVSVIVIAIIVKTTRSCIRKSKLSIPESDNKEHQVETRNACSAHFAGLSKSFGEAVILVISSIVVLSYTKLSTTSAQLLYVKTLSRYDKSASNLSVVSIAGQFKDSWYIYYQVPAIVIEIYLVVFVLLLLDYPLRIVEYLVRKVHYLKVIYPAQTINRFFNEFQSCFRPKFKFFAGIYYIFRLTTSSIFITSYTLLYTITSS